jgi:hypothetical protein
MCGPWRQACCPAVLLRMAWFLTCAVDTVRGCLKQLQGPDILASL